MVPLEGMGAAIRMIRLKFHWLINDLLWYQKIDFRVPLTLSAAKKYNIRHARFPTRHVFGVQPALDINTCVAILNDMKVN